MKYRKLETLQEAWAFYENVKAYPITEVGLANEAYVYSVSYDKFFVQEFLDYLDPDEETIRLKSFEAWAKHCEYARLVGYTRNRKYFGELPVELQRECYRISQKHPYCNSPASKQWAHMEKCE